MDRASRPLRVLFRVAAGPRSGFGHLVRATSLARALGVPALLSVRGAHASIRPTARRLGASLVPGAAPARTIAAVRPDVLVIDDRVASRTAPWRRAARLLGVPIVSVHDLGIGLGDADILVDGSIGSAAAPGPRVALAGTRYAILNPRIVGSRRTAAGPRADVVIALGGGPRRTVALRLAAALHAKRGRLKVAVAGGFVGHGAMPAAEAMKRSIQESPSAPRVTWVGPDRLGAALSASTVAVVGGGVTLYECLALGVPSVAVSVVASQRPTIGGFAARRVVVDGGSFEAQGRRQDGVGALADRVLRLLDDPVRRARMQRAGRRLVDGNGGARVARAIEHVVGAGRGRKTARPR